MLRSVSTVCVIWSVLLTGCGFHATPIAYGGVGAAAAGAGVGAIVGKVISNGDVVASSLLGGAIGIPVGLALGAYYDYHSDESVRERKMVEIQKNQDELFSSQREIDVLREQIRNENGFGSPPEELRDHQFNGATLGNLYR